MYEYNDQERNWNQVDLNFSITSPVNDLAFAPNPGKSYHCLAVAAADVHIYQLKPLQRSVTITQQPSLAKDGASPGGKYMLDKVAVLENETGAKGAEAKPAWRVSWNATGKKLKTETENETALMLSLQSICIVIVTVPSTIKLEK